VSAPETVPQELGLAGAHKDLYEHLRNVLERHMDSLRKMPLTGDLINETVHAFDDLDALVEDLKVPQYDLETAHGRLLSAVAALNKTMPGVALRTLNAVYRYLATSDDDGVTTRETAMGIIRGVGLTKDQQLLGDEMVKIFPPLP
jgi:hypothetical protein